MPDTDPPLEVTPTSEGTPTPTDLKPGAVLEEHWRLDRQIGAGGMGTVFLATDLRLGRQVAVKVLLASLAQEQLVARFEREAQVTAMLDHPNVVTLFSVGRHRGIPFMVMKYLEGESLGSHIHRRGGRLLPVEVLKITRQICAALDYIHSRGVIHRDLKPSNVFMAPNGHVTILDLGIARPRGSNMTHTGVIFGTPEIMSPEIVVGEREIDRRSDLYALGVVLFWMLTGKLPFTEKADESLMRAHITRPRPDASALCKDVSPALARVVQRAMAIKPNDRYPDAPSLLAALEVAITGRASAEPLNPPVAAPVPALEPLPDLAGPYTTPDSPRALPAPDPLITPVWSKSDSEPSTTPEAPTAPPPVSDRSTTPASPAIPRAAGEAVLPVKRRRTRELPLPSLMDDDPSEVPTSTVRGAYRPPTPRDDPSGMPKHTAPEGYGPLQDVNEAATDLKRQAFVAVGLRRADLRTRVKYAVIALLVITAVAGVLGLLLLRPDPPPKAVSALTAGPVPATAPLAPSSAPPSAPEATDDLTARKEDFDQRSKEAEQARVSPAKRVLPRLRPKVAEYFGAAGMGELQVIVLLDNEATVAEVSIDGRPVGPSPVYLPVRPGTHRIGVELRPWPASEFPISVPAKKSVRLEVELKPLRDAADP